jgi:hypothetical protein
VEWLKVKALSSSPSSAKKKERKKEKEKKSTEMMNLRARASDVLVDDVWSVCFVITVELDVSILYPFICMLYFITKEGREEKG